MPDAIEALILDLLEWIGLQPRTYSEVIDVWRTSCPRLTVWEDANERGFVASRHEDGVGTVIVVTASGRAFLATHRPRRAVPDRRGSS